MLRNLITSLNIITMSSVLMAQIPMFENPLSNRIANYKIEVTLDTKTKTLEGTEILNWHNNSDGPVNELQFHLYLNAFKNEGSTFMKEMGTFNRLLGISEKNRWGWIDITGINIVNGPDLTHKIEFIQPDDMNDLDRTVMRIVLEKPILPQKNLELKISFKAKLPQISYRTGYKGDFFLVAQWFPKIGVYEKSGNKYQWNCHQFHYNSEFFADFGTYDVKITVPEKFVVGATGILLAQENNNNGSKTLHYYCEDVHDFAWTADIDFLVIEDQWQHVKIKYMAQPLHFGQVDKQIQAVKHALEFFDTWIGTYPYTTLTIVDPQYGALGAAGMEYPTFFTTYMLWLLPNGIRIPAEIVVHEFAHNYWQGMVASNEFEEAWLDEGITTYFEIKIMDLFYNHQKGSKLNFFELGVDDAEYIWYAYSNRSNRDVIKKNAWEYMSSGSYGLSSYRKPALMLLTLENLLGEAKMMEVMRVFFERYKFKHPHTEDFITVANEISGQNLDWFFDQVLYGTAVLDYKIYSISAEKKRTELKGNFAEKDTALSTDTTYSEMDTNQHKSETIQRASYENKIVVFREGEIKFPVEILIKFEDGEEVLEKWDGKDRYKIFNINKSNRVKSAEVDPYRKVWLDINFLNNGKSLEINNFSVAKYTSRWFFWMQNLLYFISIFS